MKCNTYLMKPVLVVCLGLLMSNCSSDDDANEPQLQAWEIEVNQLKNLTSPYIDFEVANSEGRIDVSGYVPNMGHHYLNPVLVDGTFDLTQPEILLYVPDENEIMQLVAVEYGVIPENPENPGNPPEGFTGDEDEWHFNEMVGQWQLHVWTVLENPNGIFAPVNPVIGD